MEDFQVIQRRKIHQDIAGQIRDLIRDGVLKPGDRLPSERELAERFQVGRGSLREAMRSLELQGMVISRPGSGTYVSTESLEPLASIIVSTLTGANRDLEGIFEVRHLLEPHIASLAAERSTSEDCDRMQEAIEDQDDAHAWFNMGSNFVNLGMYDAAAQAYDKAISLGLPWRMFWYQFGAWEAYYHTERYDDMIRIARQNQNDGGGQYVEETYYYLGMAREGRGELDKALQNYITALTFNPNFTPAREARDRLRAAGSS